MNLSQQSQFSSKVSQLLSWGHWFTFANIGLVLFISVSYLVADSAPTTFMGYLYMLVTWLSHTSFITFIAFVLTIFPLSLVFPYPRHIRGMAAIIATLGASLLTLDAYVYFNLGYHLNTSALPEIVSLLWHRLTSSPALTTILAGGIVLLILAFQLLVSNYTWHHLARLKQYKFPRYATSTILVCFALSHSIHIWADANLKFDITKQDNVLPLSYPTTAKSLLAKNDLLDIESYKEAHDVRLDPHNIDYLAPTPLAECKADSIATIDILVFENNNALEQFVSTEPALRKTDLFLQPIEAEDTLFSLVYGLPAFYKAPILDKQQLPVWLADNRSIQINGFEQFEFINNEDINPAIRLIRADETTRPREAANAVFAFSLANNSNGIVTASRLYSSDKKVVQTDGLIQPSDIIATSVGHYFSCNTLAKQTMLGSNLYKRHDDTGVNYSQDVFIAFKKDRITLIDSDGNFKNISAAQGFAIEQRLDVPFLVQSIKKLKRYTP
ncbi:DUF3413 domain-containing protein [Pseudoalteromonas sp. MEBiC 03607]|uniref:DUF3413 domain-containing protein n=1 Tax=Pseudoalteromonas sp. MEBiC 03607 TaxID=2563601 RepID=UPI001093C52F|nr:DUF3413 domain-containing protein [Pseudoalteromonas sp. MEBiC 03607]TGV20403.1 DUF3413 domain-containing protein [Pseudoalteromonas sp. MEBiC 03607]